MRKYADIVRSAGLRSNPINTQMTQKLCEITRKYAENVNVAIRTVAFVRRIW